MSNLSVYAKTKFILKMIDNIKRIITKHGGIVKALEDELEAQPAILMALLQIGESLNKIDKEIIKKYEGKSDDLFFSYQIVSFKLGIAKDFYLYDGEELINIDEISTLRKRLKHSMRNTVPFYLYSTKKYLTQEMKTELRNILFDIFGE